MGQHTVCELLFCERVYQAIVVQMFTFVGRFTRRISVANWSPKLGEEAVVDEIQRAFDSWSGYSRLTFRHVRDNTADIIIAFGRSDHRDGYPFDGPGGILAHAFYPYEMGSFGGDIHFDDDEEWKINPGELEDGVDFFTVAVHELGHSLGLSHSPISSSIMFPYYKGFQRHFQLDYDDILAMYQLYTLDSDCVLSSGKGRGGTKLTTFLFSSYVRSRSNWALFDSPFLEFRIPSSGMPFTFPGLIFLVLRSVETC
uniref:Peptidase metallopeptidase domain-containing protein n=1 Tax=Timema cristinae TaxID=61476 RepID=A0A7R9DA63_TIMCR|nr:unnamed protein product [Timema cristinae]